MRTLPGLSDATSVSGNGRYRDFASEEILALHTCCWRGQEFVTLGEEAQALFSPNLPTGYRVRQRHASWTGKAYDYSWPGGDLTLELRTTLPGPLWCTRGRVIRIRAAPGAEWRSFEDLDGEAPTLGCIGSQPGYRATCLLSENRHLPVVLIASHPIIAIRIISHMYYEFEFARDDVRLLVVPLLMRSDIPRDPAVRAIWRELARRPPVAAEETFHDDGETLTIHAHFPKATRAPLPVLLALLGSSGELVAPPQAQTLMHSWCGPYQVVAGNRYQATVRMPWSTASLRPTTTVTGQLNDIPEELAYAGDATWEVGTAMDQLLALRTWAPLLQAMPEELRARMLPLLRPPESAAWTEAVEIIREPTSRLPWGRLRSMWAHNGDACYDVDWYNGLALSGLARAIECGIPEIAIPAERTARAGRRQRAALYDYFTVFCDWSACSAWTDPRGWLWNADCLHNGLEGLLAEGRMRAREGDRAGAAHARYLAARHAISLRASLELPAWTARLKAEGVSARATGHRVDCMVNWSGTATAQAPTPRDIIGIQAFSSWREITLCSVFTRNPYCLAGLNPEWNALLRSHTSRAWQQSLARAYDRQQERYSDWIAFYLGKDWQERRAKGDQEARIQASVFYAVSPEIAFRRFVRRESAATIECRYATPLPLSEQLLVRGGYVIAEKTEKSEATQELAAHGERAGRHGRALATAASARGARAAR